MTNSQLSTTESKKKQKQKLKQTTDTESQKWRSHREFSVCGERGRMGGERHRE